MTTSAASCPFTFISCLSTCSIRRGKAGTGGSHPHALPSACPIGARSVFGEDAHGVYGMGWRAALRGQSQEPRVGKGNGGHFWWMWQKKAALLCICGSTHMGSANCGLGPLRRKSYLYWTFEDSSPFLFYQVAP